ncbi:MAG: DUF1573 domain-containing protein [Planctomycetia bacterium]|nr:DUF1573 domain-containing protein [Planctomycetia bacterium]
MSFLPLYCSVQESRFEQVPKHPSPAASGYPERRLAGTRQGWFRKAALLEDQLASAKAGIAMKRRQRNVSSSAPLQSMRYGKFAVITVLAVAWGVAANRPLVAQEWATKMFSVTSHNFGTVAKGSKTEYRFVFRNLYVEDVHVSGVRTSCGCTSPSITQNLLKTHETSEVVAAFNTRTFLGQHGATLTVTFDRPFSAEVQLRVAGNIRGDVTFEPASVNLGNVDLGRGAEQRVRVSHIGSTPWEITDVRSANPNFEVLLSKPSHTGSQSVYDLTLRLRPDAPAGYINDQLILVTNDPRASQIPMDVEGRVVAEVSVSPKLLALGSVSPGESITKNIVVRANRPFCVTGIICRDGCLSCPAKETPAKVHILPVTFQAGDASGRIERQLTITTDLGDGAVPVVTVQALVEPASDDDEAAGKPSTEQSASTR